MKCNAPATERVALTTVVEPHMTMSRNAVERQWHGIAPDGSEHAVALQIGLPVQQRRGEWAASAILVPIETAEHYVLGIDSWQAMDEGMRHLASMVRHYQRLGWRFFWEKGGEEVTAADLERNTDGSTS